MSKEAKNEAAESQSASKKRKNRKIKKPLALRPVTAALLSPDLPENLLSIRHTVDEKGLLTGTLLVKATDKRANEIHAVLSEKELALGRCDELAHFAVRAGFTNHLSPKGLRTLAALLPEHATGEVYVARREGYHGLTLNGQRYGFYVLAEKVLSLGSKAPLEIAVVHDAAIVDPSSGNIKDWHTTFGVHLAGNPYMLITVLVSLSSALTRPFELQLLILMIVAPSTFGKSTLQQIGRSVRERADKVFDASGTTNGLRVRMEQYADAPVFFQDVHKVEDVEGFMTLLFLVANGGQRVTSSASQKVQAGTELSCGLILSSELLFLEMVGRTKMSLPEGFSARCFEMVLQGPHGAFHKLPEGMTAHDFANQFKRDCAQHYGAVWQMWLHAVAKNADNIKNWLPSALKKAESSLLEGLDIRDRVTLRLVSGLAVWVVTGQLAIKLKVLQVKPDTVTKAVRQVLSEYCARQTHRTTPIGEKVITTVRDFIDRNGNRFPALAMFGRTDQSNLAGYTQGNGHEQNYLFLPGALEELLAETFSLQMALQKLDEAGYLVKNSEGWKLQVRVGEMRKRFYAIRSSIRFDGEHEPAQEEAE